LANQNVRHCVRACSGSIDKKQKTERSAIIDAHLLKNKLGLPYERHSDTYHEPAMNRKKTPHYFTVKEKVTQAGAQKPKKQCFIP